MAAEFDLERAKRMIEHDKIMRFEELNALMQRIDFLEEAYAKLPLQYRIPSMKRRLICLCLREVEKARSRHDAEASPLIPRFTRELLDAFGQLEEGSRTGLFATSREWDERKVRGSEKDRYRNAVEAHAAAILESAIHDAIPTGSPVGRSAPRQTEWSEKIAKCLAAAGMVGTKNSLSAGAVIKWREKFNKDIKEGMKKLGLSETAWLEPKRKISRLMVRQEYADQGEVGAPARYATKHRGTIMYADKRKRLRVMAGSIGNSERHLSVLEQELENLAATARPFLGDATTRAGSKTVAQSLAVLRVLPQELGAWGLENLK